jgi:hypothetical protein
MRRPVHANFHCRTHLNVIERMCSHLFELSKSSLTNSKRRFRSLRPQGRGSPHGSRSSLKHAHLSTYYSLLSHRKPCVVDDPGHGGQQVAVCSVRRVLCVTASDWSICLVLVLFLVIFIEDKQCIWACHVLSASLCFGFDSHERVLSDLSLFSFDIGQMS